MSPRETGLGRGRPHGDLGVGANAALSLLQGLPEAHPTPPHPTPTRAEIREALSPHPQGGGGGGLAGPWARLPCPLPSACAGFYLPVGGEGGRGAGAGCGSGERTGTFKKEMHALGNTDDPRCAFRTPFRSEGSLRTASAYARKDEDEMAKAALRGRGGRSLGAAGRWARPCPVDPRSLPSSSHSPSPTFAHFFPAPVPRARQRGCDGAGGGTPPGGSKVGRDPAGGGGARPLLRAAAVLPGRRRAGQPFEMRGAADHWSPGWGWERAAAREGPRTREGSPVRSAPRPATARELARCWCAGNACGKERGLPLLLTPEER